MFPVIFILWVACVGAFRDLYWKLSLYVILPCVVIDLVWNLITYEIKGKSILKEEEIKKDDKEN